jgi:hypothetical protein
VARGGWSWWHSPLLDVLFNPEPAEDRYLRGADQRAGAWSILTGVAANHSIASGRSIKIDDLVPGLDLPDYSPGPDNQGPIPLPDRE